jgi:hypothetical protein
LGKKSQQNFFIIDSMIKYNVRDRRSPRKKNPNKYIAKLNQIDKPYNLSSRIAQALEVMHNV